MIHLRNEIAMLNANAKAFVPGGGAQPQGVNVSNAPPPTNEVSLFRYFLQTPPLRSALLDDPPQSLSALQKLMSKRQLQSASKGGAGFAAAHLFVAEFFSSLSNNPAGPSGFILSRELLSLSAVEAIQDASQRDGFLLHLSEVPSGLGVEVGSSIAPLWEPLMAQFGQDFRVTMLGYLFFQVQPTSELVEHGEESRFLHYFFVCTTPKRSQLVQLGVSSFSNVPCKSIVELPTIVPRIFSTALSCAVLVNISASSFEGKNCEVQLYEDPSKTLESLVALQGQIEQLFALKRPHDQSEVVVVNVLEPTEKNLLGIPFVDIINMISQLCDKVMGGVVGVIASREQWHAPFISRGLQDSWRLDPSMPVVEQISLGKIVSPRSARVPFGTPMTLQNYINLSAETLEFIKCPPEGPLFNRKVLSENASHIAKEQFRIRRRTIGVPILVIVDRQGKVFCVDATFGNGFAIPACWSNSLASPHECVLQATIATSFRGDRQFRIVIHDVLRFNGSDLRTLPFSQRWASLDSLGLDDETCWPHCSPTSVVILRSLYVSQLGQCEQLLNDVTADTPSCGLQFMCASKSHGDAALNFRWIANDSLVARFVVDELESLGGNGGHQVKRAYLSCRGANGLTMFKDEFCDFHANNDTLAEGCIIECSLRRSQNSSDVSHWWELVNEFSPTDQTVCADSETAIEAMIVSPMLSLEELRWLPKASNYLCGRCQSVNDIGKPLASSVYQCRTCWEETGHGDCVNCNAAYVTGSIDSFSGRFYCDGCWNLFTTPKPPQAWAPPPPPDATFSKIVSTRVISLFIDRAAAKGSNGDILELCCGGSVVRKWMNAGVNAYVGIDINQLVVDETLYTIKQQGSSTALPSSPTAGSSRSQLKMHSVICADAFDPQSWVHRVAQVHPNQFHTITCFGGLQNAFSTEQRARDTLFAISNALVPNGLFIGALWSANALLRKGAEYENTAFRCTWDESPSPRIGSTYTLEFLDNTSETGSSADSESTEEPHHVVPLDFLVAIAGEYKLELIRDYTFTFADLLSDDDRWTRPLSADEKELLAMRMTFGFRKSFQREPSK